MAERAIPPILLVQLRPRSPSGQVVGESRRVCHLVPVPQSGDVPAVLRAYCGQTIPPGAADLLDRISGAPCERCLQQSPIPAFAMLRELPTRALDASRDPDEHDEVAGWWDLGLLPDQKITARFVLLLMLQNITRARSVAEIAHRLHQPADTVNLIVLLHAAAGWFQPVPDRPDQTWADRQYRLTERGATRARRVLADSLTPTFAALAAHLGLDTTVTDPHEGLGPGGRSDTPDPAAPAGPRATRTRPEPDHDDGAP